MGKGIFWERNAITKPCSFLITALIPAQFSLAKRAPSELILYNEAFGGFQEVAGRIHCGGLLVMPRTPETDPWPVEEAVSV
nr:hypothetical protein CFP56_78598 [Quercus suber]